MSFYHLRSGRCHHRAPRSGRLRRGGHFAGRLLVAGALTVSMLIAAAAPVPSAQAQDLAVVSTEPAQGSAGVPLKDTVYFDFSAAVTVATDWDGLFAAEPRSRILRRGAALCIQARGICAAGDATVPRFVRLPVEHEPETDYTWFVEAVQTPGGEILAAPFTLHYTTAATIGERHVRGTVTPVAVAGKQTSLVTSPAARRAAHALRTAAAHLEREGMGTLSYRNTEGGSTEGRNAAAGKGFASPPTTTDAAAVEGPGHTRILLLTNFFTNSQLWSVRGGSTMRTPAGAYDIPYVRAGRYWPLAVRYADAAATRIEALGFYDPDGDGAPDPVEVGAADANEVDLTMYTFAPTTALAHIETAADLAGEIAGDQELKAIESTQQLYTDGTAYTWSYTYYAPSRALVTTVVVDPLSADTLTTPDLVEVAAQPSLDPSRLVDTDIVLRRVMDGGGAAFIAPFPERRRSSRVTTSTGGTLPGGTLPGGEPRWEVTLEGRTSSGAVSYTRSVTMYSGSVVSRESTPRSAAPEAELTVFPSPFQDRATIAFAAPNGSAVRLSVYDVLGRQVAPITTAHGGAGRQTAVWDGRDAAGVPVQAGLYFIRLETSAGTLVRAVTRLR